jgi:GNAT superfamily N-acetyltransferase
MSSTSASIRRAGSADCAALTRVMHASSAYRGTFAAILDGYAVTPSQVETDLVYLAEAQGDVLGFYSLVVDDDGAAELDLMFVADAAQGQGLGARLFADMRELARELGITRVTIVAHPPAEAFYRRQGAARVGTRAASGRVTWARPVLMLEIAPR